MTRKLSKSEKRKKRQEEKERSRQDKAVRLGVDMGGEGKKRVKIAPIPEIPSKVVKVHGVPNQSKSVYTATESGFSNDCHLTWCTTIADVEGEWSWQEPRAWTEEEWQTQISRNFAELERLTWSEILFQQKTVAKGNKSVSKHHFQEVETLVAEAQDRWLEIELEEYDVAFRFRFANTIRAWGIKLEGHFYLVWWERYHRIYPVAHG